MDLLNALQGAWGAPGAADVARTAISQATSSWGIPGDVIAPLLPAVAQPAPAVLPKPSLDPGQQTTSPVANVHKQDAQPAAGFLAANGRMLAIIGGLLAVVLLVVTVFRRGR